ncbi:MAG TPA: FeoB-associated Cys-rich membrane protein [Lentisphaeria bacterium]|nr:FeoB-associated Cys-rich membrane protein [Lentisphaeria bacterium]
MIEYIIVGLIVAIALFAGGRSLWRTWTGQDTNGCAGCTSCSSSPGCGAMCPRPLRQGKDSNSDCAQ